MKVHNLTLVIRYLHIATICFRRILCFLLAFIGIFLADAGVCRGVEYSDDRLIDECEESMARADYVRAEQLARRLLSRGEATHSGRCRSYGQAYLGSFYVSRGRLEEGFKMLHGAREWAREERNDTVIAIALNGLGIYYVMADNNLVIFLGHLLSRTRVMT